LQPCVCGIARDGGVASSWPIYCFGIEVLSHLNPLTRRNAAMSTVLRVLCLAFVLAVHLPAVADAASDYPSKPIRFIVPSSPGGPVDLIARRFSDKLSSRVGQTIIVENRAGGRTIGPGEVAKAAPDGYTLLFTVDTYLTVNPALYPKLQYDPRRDFAPVAILAALNNFILSVHPSVPVRTVREYVDMAKGKPGAMSAANAGLGSPAHLVTALFALRTNVDLLQVPYKGGNLAVSDLIGGHVNSMFAPAQNAVGPIKQKMLVPLAVTGNKRFALLPDVPTFAEAGFPEVDLSLGFWYGVVAPAATPSDVVAKLAKELIEIAKSAEMVKSLAAIGIESVGIGPKEMGKIMQDDMARWSIVIREAGIKLP
jgi:tripartite-type tricarboxylate transporter receptor subunit TctC